MKLSPLASVLLFFSGTHFKQRNIQGYGLGSRDRLVSALLLPCCVTWVGPVLLVYVFEQQVLQVHSRPAT